MMQIHEKPQGATNIDLLEWETFFECSMPEDHKLLLLNSDGPILYDPKTQKELQFLSAKDAIDYYESFGFKNFCWNAVPICMDGCSNIAVYKKDNGLTGIYWMSCSNICWEDSIENGKNINDIIADEELINQKFHRQ